jgi:5-deoxy-glucuronate isomerase
MTNNTASGRHPWHLGAVAEVTPEIAGWSYTGLRILPIAPGGVYDLVTGDTEMAVLPLSGGPVTIDVEGRHFELHGRATVFSAVSDWAYLPIGAEVRLSSASGAEVA